MKINNKTYLFSIILVIFALIIFQGCTSASEVPAEPDENKLEDQGNDLVKMAANEVEEEKNIPAQERKKETVQVAEESEAEKSEAAAEKNEASDYLLTDTPVINVDENNMLILVNKNHRLPSTYVPSDLITVNVPFPFSEDLPKKKMRKEAAVALEKLFDAAQKEGLSLYAQSGYRSYSTQEAIFKRNAQKYGEQKANTFSARAGESEHQTGLAMDVTSSAVGYALVESFATTEEGEWLTENAAQFGFIIRYPKGKEKITGYTYEPWHLRYVGKEAAKKISEKGVTLEEYLNQD
jgi:D-alanyl-D-alanine carboxypeptidase